MAKSSEITSGLITLDNIREEFGITGPISLGDMYAGGAYIQAGYYRTATGAQAALDGYATNQPIPSQGRITLAHFYGVRKLPFIIFNKQKDPQNPSGVDIPILTKTERLSTPTVKDIRVYFDQTTNKVMLEDINTTNKYELSQPIDITDSRVSIRVSNLQGSGGGILDTDIVVQSQLNQVYSTTAQIGQLENRQIQVQLKDNVIFQNIQNFIVTLKAENTFVPLTWRNVSNLETRNEQLVNGTITARSQIEYTTAIQKARIKINTDWQEITDQQTTANRVEFKARLISPTGTLTSGDSSNTWKPIQTLAEWVTSTGINQTKTAQVELTVRDGEQTSNTNIYNLSIVVVNTFQNITWGSDVTAINQTQVIQSLLPSNGLVHIVMGADGQATITDNLGTSRVVSSNAFGRLEYKIRTTSGTNEVGTVDNTWKTATNGQTYSFGVTVAKQTTEAVQYEIQFRDSLNNSLVQTRTVNLSVQNQFVSIVWQNITWNTVTVTSSNAVSVGGSIALNRQTDGKITLDGTSQVQQVLSSQGYGRVEFQMQKTSGADWVGTTAGWTDLITLTQTILRLKDTTGALAGTYQIVLRDKLEPTNTKTYQLIIQVTNTFKTMTINNVFQQTGNIKNATKTDFINGNVESSFSIQNQSNVLSILTQNGENFTVSPNTYGRIQFRVTPNANITTGQAYTTWQDVPTGTFDWKVVVGKNQTRTGQVQIEFRDGEEVQNTSNLITINLTATNTFIDIVWNSAYAGQTFQESQFVNGPVQTDFNVQLNSQNILTDQSTNQITQNGYGRVQIKTTLIQGTFGGGTLLQFSNWTDLAQNQTNSLFISTGVNQTKTATLRIEYRDKLNTTNVKQTQITLTAINTFIPFSYVTPTYAGATLQTQQFVNATVSTTYQITLDATGKLTQQGTILLNKTYGRLQFRIDVTEGQFQTGQTASGAWLNWSSAGTYSFGVTTDVDQTKTAKATISIRDSSDTQNVQTFPIQLTATNTFKRIVWTSNAGQTVSNTQLVNGDVSQTYTVNHTVANLLQDQNGNITSNTYGRIQIKYTQISGTPTGGQLSQLTQWTDFNGTAALNQTVTTGINQTKTSVFKLQFRDNMDTSNTTNVTITLTATNTFVNIVWLPYTGTTVQATQEVPNGAVYASYNILHNASLGLQDTQAFITNQTYDRLEFRYVAVQGVPNGNLSSYTNWGGWNAGVTLSAQVAAGNNQTQTCQFRIEFRDRMNTANTKQITVNVSATNTFVPISFAGNNTTFSNLSQFVVDGNCNNEISISRNGQNQVVINQTSGGQLTICQNDRGRSRITTSAKSANVTGSVTSGATLGSELRYGTPAGNNSTQVGSITVQIYDQLDPANSRTVVITWGSVNTYVPIVWASSANPVNFGVNQQFVVDGAVQHQVTAQRVSGVVKLTGSAGGSHIITNNDAGGRVRFNVSFNTAPNAGGGAVQNWNPDGTGWNNSVGNNATHTSSINVTAFDSAKPQNQYQFTFTHGAQNTYVPIGFYTGNYDFGRLTTGGAGGIWHQIQVRTVGNRIYMRDDQTGAEVTLCDNDLGRARVSIWMGSGQLNGGTTFQDQRPGNHAVQIYTGDNQSKDVAMYVRIYDSSKPSNVVDRLFYFQVTSQYINQNPIGTPNQIRSLSIVIQTGGAYAGIEYFMSGSALYQRIIKGAAETDYQIGTNTTGAGWDIQFTVVSQNGSGGKYIKPSTARHQIGSSSRIYVAASVQSGTQTSEQVINVKIWDRQSGALMYDGNQRIYAEAGGAIH